MDDDRESTCRPGRGRGLIVVVGLLGGALTGRGSDAGTSSPNTGKAVTTKPAGATGTVFTDPQFTFDFTYPKGWVAGEVKGDPAQTAGARATARAAVGFDENNSVFLTRYDLPVAVTSAELGDQMTELNGVITQFAGRPYSGTTTEIGGLPAVRYEEFALQDDPDNRSSRVVFLFDSSLEYEINCQSTARDRNKMNQGCDQILTTLRKK